MRPFDDYHGGGYTMLPKLKGGNARQDYGHWLVERGQTSCAYCKMSLVDSYEHWLLLTVDHVIPVSNKDRRDGHPAGNPQELARVLQQHRLSLFRLQRVPQPL